MGEHKADAELQIVHQKAGSIGRSNIAIVSILLDSDCAANSDVYKASGVEDGFFSNIFGKNSDLNWSQWSQHMKMARKLTVCSDMDSYVGNRARRRKLSSSSAPQGKASRS